MSRTAMLLATTAMLAASLPSEASPSASAELCAPEILILPALAGQEFTFVGAINDQGWAVGSSSVRQPNTDFTWYSTAVLWRDGAVIDLGMGGKVLPDGVVSSSAVDVNKDGVIVGYRARLRSVGSFSFKEVSSHAWIWRDGEATRLATSRTRPVASVWAVNDRGVAVGEVADTRGGKSSRPVIWRYGHQIPLPIPPGAVGGTYDINDEGLVIGWVRSPGGDYQEWHWRLGGTSGPLRQLSPSSPGGVKAVDNRDRILGSGWDHGRHALLWRGPESQPVRFGGYALANANDMNDDGDLTGYRGGWRGYGASAWVSNLKAEKVHSLPAPKSFSWSNMAGTSVIRGVTWFAPSGGVSVAGYGAGYDEGWAIVRAVIWTCAQTY